MSEPVSRWANTLYLRVIKLWNNFLIFSWPPLEQIFYRLNRHVDTQKELISWGMFMHFKSITSMCWVFFCLRTQLDDTAACLQVRGVSPRLRLLWLFTLRWAETSRCDIHTCFGHFPRVDLHLSSWPWSCPEYLKTTLLFLEGPVVVLRGSAVFLDQTVALKVLCRVAPNSYIICLI